MFPSKRAAALAAAMLSSAALAAGPGLLVSGPERAEAFLANRSLVPPVAVMPIRATPEYGDGLGADRGHEGVDLFAPTGTALVATREAVVLETSSDGARGNYVSIYSAAAQQTYNYFHMLSPAIVRAGQHLGVGQKLGELGCTGSCSGDHLHFEVRTGRDSSGPLIDPVPILRKLQRNH